MRQKILKILVLIILPSIAFAQQKKVDAIRLFYESTVLGARMMGGGFGGCTINLVKSAEADSSVSRIMEKYKEQTQIQPEAYLVSIEDGVNQVKL